MVFCRDLLERSIGERDEKTAAYDPTCPARLLKVPVNRTKQCWSVLAGRPIGIENIRANGLGKHVRRPIYTNGSPLDSVSAAFIGKRRRIRTFSREECPLVVSCASVHRLSYHGGCVVWTVIGSVALVGLV